MDILAVGVVVESTTVVTAAALVVVVVVVVIGVGLLLLMTDVVVVFAVGWVVVGLVPGTAVVLSGDGIGAVTSSVD